MIYSSPMTRCVQTAIQLQSFLKVPIRVEYGITEPGRLIDDGHSLPELINGKFVKLQPDYDEVDGKFFILILMNFFILKLCSKDFLNWTGHIKVLFSHKNINLCMFFVIMVIEW